MNHFGPRLAALLKPPKIGEMLYSHDSRNFDTKLEYNAMQYKWLVSSVARAFTLKS